MSHQRASSLAANLLRTTQVATGRIVPLTGLLSLLDLVVVAEVEPLQTSARITHLDGDDLRRDPLEVRKATLASIVAKASPGVRFNEHIEGDGPTVFAHACKMGLEGIVSKRKDSTYRSGRSPVWLKMKNPDAPAVKREAEEEWG